MTRTADETEAIAELFRVLGHGLRMAILQELSGGERAVGDIASATGLGMSTLSQQLATLRKAELVLARREAKQVFYSLNSATLARARDELGALCQTAASDLAPAATASSVSGRVGAAMFARVQPRS